MEVNRRYENTLDFRNTRGRFQPSVSARPHSGRCSRNRDAGISRNVCGRNLFNMADRGIRSSLNEKLRRCEQKPSGANKET